MISTHKDQALLAVEHRYRNVLIEMEIPFFRMNIVPFKLFTFDFWAFLTIMGFQNSTIFYFIYNVWVFFLAEGVLIFVKSVD